MGEEETGWGRKRGVTEKTKLREMKEGEKGCFVFFVVVFFWGERRRWEKERRTGKERHTHRDRGRERGGRERERDWQRWEKERKTWE